MKRLIFKNNYFCLRKREKGYALLITLWVVFIFALLASTYFYQSYTSARLVQSQFDRVRARNLAQIGLARGVTDLKNDMIWALYRGETEYDWMNEPRNYDAKNNIWYSELEYHEKNYPFENEEQGYFEVMVYPLNDRLDINRVPFELLELYFQKIEVPREKATELARAIIDWRSPGDKVMDKDIDKIEFYNEGRTDDPEYVPIKRYFKVMEEILDVKGITPELFWGIDERNRLIKRQLLFNPFEYYSAEEERQLREKKGLLDVFTVYNIEDKINVNFVNQFVLNIMVEAATGDAASAANQAEKVIEYRDDKDKCDYEDVVPYKTLSDLDFSSANLPPEVINQLTVNSKIFRIISRGTFRRVQYTVVADVSRTWEEKQLVDNWDLKWETKVGTDFFPVIRIIDWTEK